MDQPKKQHLSQTTYGKATSTITQPNVKAIIRAIATILHSQMLEDQGSGKELNPNSELYFFSEEKYIQEKPEEFDEQRKALLRAVPTVDNIDEFMLSTMAKMLEGTPLELPKDKKKGKSKKGKDHRKR